MKKQLLFCFIACWQIACGDKKIVDAGDAVLADAASHSGDWLTYCPSKTKGENNNKICSPASHFTCRFPYTENTLNDYYKTKNRNL